MSYSVKVPGLPSLFFLTDPPDDREGLEYVREGEWVEVPMNVYLWPEGAPRPEPVLCRSINEPGHYKLFKYRDEVDPAEWEEAGLNFGGTFSSHSWADFAGRLGSIRALQAIPDGEGS